MNDFKLRNKNDVIEAILGILRQLYTNIVTKHNISIKDPNCNIILLDQALIKYSRDIYGGKRLKARIENNNQLTTMSKKIS